LEISGARIASRLLLTLGGLLAAGAFVVDRTRRD
jgi:hypothetical protein